MARKPSECIFSLYANLCELAEMVEIWFGILTRQSLRGASFSSTQALSEHIVAFVEAYNQDAQPFVWRKREVKGCQLRNNARNFCN